MQFSEDNFILLVATDDKHVRLIDLRDDEPKWQTIAELDEGEIDGHPEVPKEMPLSRDDNMVALEYRRYPLSAWELDGPMHISHCYRTDERMALRQIANLSWYPHRPKAVGLVCGEPYSNGHLTTALPKTCRPETRGPCFGSCVLEKMESFSLRGIALEKSSFTQPMGLSYYIS